MNIVDMIDRKENTINNLNVELLYSSLDMEQDDALPTAERMYNELLLPTLNAVLNDYDEDFIVVEKLDIDLGIVKQEDIPVRLSAILREKLDSQIALGVIKEDESSDSLTLHEKNNKQFALEKHSRLNNPITLSGWKQEKILDGVLDYLVNETIPWHVEHTEFLTSSWLDSMLRYIAEDVMNLDKVIHAMQQHDSALVRVLYECADSVLSIIARRLLLEYKNLSFLDSMLETMQRSTLVSLVSYLLCIDSDMQIVAHLPLPFIQQVNHYSNQDVLSQVNQLLEQINSQGPVVAYLTLSTLSNEQFMQVAQVFLCRGLGENEFNAIVKEKNNSIRILRLIHFMLENTIGKKVSQRMGNNKLPESNLKKFQVQTNEFMPDILQDIEKWNDEHSEDLRIIQEVKIPEEMLQRMLAEERNKALTHEGQKFYTETAGLVLVHPFLTHLFDNLKMLDEKHQFKSVSAAVHAVHLLNYVSGNVAQDSSHLLVVEKLLCGLPPTFPILGVHEISSEEKEEVESMLQALCRNWPSLSTTSTAGLQQSFLRRFGFVESTSDYWTIHVESSAIDILMDDLPWGVSTIILPWCEDVIWVDWQTE